MKTRRSVLYFLSAVWIFLMASGASAAGPYGISVSGGTDPFIAGAAGSGAGAPDYSDAFGPGWLLRVEPYYDATPVLRLQIGFLYEQRSGKTFENFEFDELKRGAIYIGGKARLMPNSSLRPYLVVDLGFGKINRADVTLLGVSAKYWKETNTVYLDFGGGLEYAVSPNLGFFVDLRVETFGKPDSNLPPASDADASWSLPVTAGLNYSF